MNHGDKLLKKVISGGQTGVDQAALRAAADHGLETGGWCPPGCRSEDGPIPAIFGLCETPQEVSPGAERIPRSQRTLWNVRDSDATLVFNPEELNDKGTMATLKFARELDKAVYIIGRTGEEDAVDCAKWIRKVKAEVLNVAGPSESTCPGIGRRAGIFMSILFENL